MNESQLDVKRMIENLRKNPNIKEKKLSDNISSFNFTRKAFKKGVWDNETIRARGLFVNTETFQIVNRAYDKFFNIEEVEETSFKNLRKKVNYPITAYVKYNGYLGMLGYDEGTDELIFSTKSCIDSIHAKWFKEIFYGHLIDKDASIMKIKKFLKDHNLSLVFEVCDGVNDEHIINLEGKRKLYFLEAVKRTIEYQPMYYLGKMVSILGNFETKKLIKQFYSFSDFYNFYNEITLKDFLLDGKHIEGFVCKDLNNFQFKIKTPYYKKWKNIRYLKDFLEREKDEIVNKRLKKETDEEVKLVIYFMQELKDKNQLKDKNICQIRKKFYERKNDCSIK